MRRPPAPGRCCYAISFPWRGGGYLSNYIHTALAGLFQSGVYSGLLYWLTLWLAVVCALISAYWVMRSFAQQRAEAQSLALKNKLVMDGYRAIEGRMREGAALRHEYRHQLTAMDLLYRKGDYRGIGAMLEELHRQNEKQAQTQFTENFTMNAILQDAASRAARESTSFEAQVHVPAELAIPENDLCVLLMNMLDNALEACAGVEPPAARYIRFKAEMKNGFLAIRCENSYAGSLKTDGQGHLTTTKAEPESHGFGLKQMSATAEKYHSLLDISFTEKEHVFVAQTALKLPEKKARKGPAYLPGDNETIGFPYADKAAPRPWPGGCFSMPTQYLQRIIFLYSVGGRPVFFLKFWEKWNWLL